VSGQQRPLQTSTTGEGATIPTGKELGVSGQQRPLQTSTTGEGAPDTHWKGGWGEWSATSLAAFYQSVLVTANVVPSSPILLTLMMEALSSSETSILTSATRRNIPEECHSSGAIGPYQSCHSRVQVPQNIRPYLAVSFETGFPSCRLLLLPS
jgi:hypothetical protein